MPEFLRPTLIGRGIGAMAIVISIGIGGCWKPTDGLRSPPNVLILLIDALRADHLRCYGYERDTSPNIDLFAKGSVFFENAYAQSPWTKPSIPTLFTSLYPIQHGVYEGERVGRSGQLESDVLPDECFTLAEAMLRGGYRTVAYVNNAHLERGQGMAQGFETYEQDNLTADEIHEKFYSFLDQNDDRPFFAYLHYLDVHWPFRPAAPYNERFPSPPGHMELDKKTWRSLRDQIREGLEVSEADQKHLVSLHDGGIAQLDHEIGSLLASLSERGLLENTVILLTSDHGEELFDHGKVGHGGTLFEEVVHVPLMIRCPGRHGSSINRPARLLDVFPTLAALTNAPLPSHCEGQDLLNPREDVPELVAETKHKRTYKVSVRSEEWKYVRTWTAPRRLRVARGSSDGRTEELLGVRPGMRVKVRVLREPPGGLRAEKVSFKDSHDADLEIQAPLASVLERDRCLGLLGFTGRLASDAKLDGFTSLGSLRIGDWVKVEGNYRSGGRLEVDRVEAIVEEDADLEIEGLVGAVQSDGEGGGSLTIADESIMITGATRMKGFSGEEGERAVPRPSSNRTLDPFSPDLLLPGSGLPFEEQLFHLPSDPGELHDMAKEHPRELEGLRAQLMGWLDRVKETRHFGKVPSKPLDDATVERLRELGYIR